MSQENWHIGEAHHRWYKGGESRQYPRPTSFTGIIAENPRLNPGSSCATPLEPASRSLLIQQPSSEHTIGAGWFSLSSWFRTGSEWMDCPYWLIYWSWSLTGLNGTRGKTRLAKWYSPYSVSNLPDTGRVETRALSWWVFCAMVGWREGETQRRGSYLHTCLIRYWQ